MTSKQKPPRAVTDPTGEHPASLMDSLRDLSFVCPLCRGRLLVSADAYRCPGCQRSYPLQGGIPDFRVFPDPYLGFEEDRDRTEFVLESLHQGNLESLLERYWSRSDVTPEVLRRRFIRSALLGELRASRLLQGLSNGTFREPVTARRVLEIGSGTGNFLATATGHFDRLVGVDIAMRWLHLSRRRFLDRGLPPPPLVCCCAEYLPFADAQFDLVVATSTLEFARDPGRMVAESARVLADRGCAYINTVNRFSLARDPYVYLWGIGFLPRAWQAGYARRRRKAKYGNIKTLSYFELKNLVADSFATAEFALPDFNAALVRQLPRWLRLQVGAYQMLRRLPLFRLLLLVMGPQWDVKLAGRRVAAGRGGTTRGQPAREPLPEGVAARPLISVVIASVNGLPGLAECLESLRDQEGRVPAEILVVDRCGEDVRAIIRSRFPGVRIIAVEGRPSIPELHARGIAQARGRVIAFTEDHCIAHPRWFEVIRRAHDAGRRVVGGPVENLSVRRAVDWAAFFCEYARFMPPVPRGTVPVVAGNNMAIDRRLLDHLEARLRAGVWEPFSHASTKQRGVDFYSDPEMVVRHKKRFDYGYFLAQRYHYSRSFAGMRLSGASVWKRLAYAAATAFLPGLLLARITLIVARKGGYWGAYARSLPSLGTFLISWSVGEGVGALLGPGQSAQRVE